MTKKQIIVYGLKIVDVSKIRDNRGYSFYDPCQARPFINHFQKIFKELGKDIRKKIVDLYIENPSDPTCNLDKIKKILKNHYLDENDPFKEYNDKKIRETIFKNRRIPLVKIIKVDLKTPVVNDNNFESSIEISTCGIRTRKMHRKTLHKI